MYLASCLDAEDGYSGFWVTLELVNQLDSLGGRDAAIDADITSLSITTAKFQRRVPLTMADSRAEPKQRAAPDMCPADGPRRHRNLWRKCRLLESALFHSDEQK